jgi:methionyl-tRNA formyltransferase
MKIALLMNKNAYAGREYLQQLKNAGLYVDIIAIGDYPEENRIEDERCNGLWKPKRMEDLVSELELFSFASLKADDLQDHLLRREYDIGILGGTGILKSTVIERFGLGIFNFHPGDLPGYRGCSAPEWQIIEGKDVVSTCHLVDEGIDTGKIYAKKVLGLDYSSYNTMRATVYPETAKFMVCIIKSIISHGGFLRELIAQNETEALYRKYIGDDRIKEIDNILSKRGDTK